MRFTARRAFDSDSQISFAKLSGDRNPIHLDPIAARRTQFGAPIVHGIHSLLWALDAFPGCRTICEQSKSIHVQFPKPIYVGQDVVLEVYETGRGETRARILADSAEAVSILFSTVSLREPTAQATRTYSTPVPPPDCAHDVQFSDMAGRGGCLSLSSTIPQAKSMFPAAVGALGSERIAALAGTSCVVGMLIPGLHSLYSGLQISFSRGSFEHQEGLHFSVLSTNPRFRLIRIAAKGPGVDAILDTVSRPRPATQPNIRAVASAVPGAPFKGSRALIIGGSRGIGEVAAKLVAAGGGSVVLSYATGKDDADAVVNEISSAGFSCASIHYDIRNPPSEQLTALPWSPTHVYYFATPAIFRPKARVFDNHRLNEFEQFYIHAFFELIEACKGMTPHGLKVFYPSSTALDTRPLGMTEYTMSKAAAEVLCADMRKSFPGMQVIVHRLPRLITDQTTSVVQVETADPVSVMLPIAREMHDV